METVTCASPRVFPPTPSRETAAHGRLCRLLPYALVVGAVSLATARAISPARAAVAPDRAQEQSFLDENHSAIATMMAAMAIRPTGDVDRDFVAMMVPHHQGAIEMAKAELRYGRNARLRRIAQEIVVDQMREIARMRLAVGEAPPPSIASPTDPSRAPTPQPQAIPRMAPHMSTPMNPHQTTTQ